MKKNLFFSALLILLFPILLIKAEHFILVSPNYYTYSVNSLSASIGDASIAHWAPGSSHGYYLTSSAGDGLSLELTQQETQKSIDAWGNISTKNISLSYYGYNPSLSWGEDGINVIHWAEDGDRAWASGGPLYLYPNAGGLTIIKVNSKNELIEADVLMNGKNKVWVAPGEIYDPHEIRGCLTHELGHSIGLGHSDPSAQETMNVYGTGWDPRILSFNDIVGASFVGGYLIRNESFSRPMYFDWPITIASGTTIYFNTGTNVYLQSGNSMTINGNLVVNGTSTNKINFQRNGTSGRWGNLIFDGYGVSGSSLNNVNLYNGNEIRVMNSAKVTVLNCLLKDFYHGIYIYKASPTITGNNIDNPYQNGIYGEASGLYPVITNNVITKTNHSGQGIHLMNSTTGYIAHNEISGCDYGVYIGSATAFFSDKALSMFYPNNKFTDNNTAMCAAWGGFISGGQLNYNTAYNTIHPSRSYDAYAYQSGILVAQYNYWEGYNPKVYYDGTSSVSVANMLADDPWTTPYGMSVATGTGSSVEMKNSLSKTTATETDPVDLSAGVKLEKEGRLGDAISWYKTLVNSEKYQPFALSELMRIKNMYSNGDILNYLEGLSKVKKNSYLLKLLGDNWLQMGQFDKAVAWFDNAVSLSASESETLDAKFSKLFAFINVKKDLGKAREILSDIKKGNTSDFYFSSRIEAAENLMGNPSAYSANKGEKQENSGQSLENSGVVTEYSLTQNYPNPFNPSTSIRYELPSASKVELKVYDILGKEVMTLVNGIQEAGRYNASFNAFGLPSGIYIYSFKAMSLENGKNFERNSKMLYLK